MGYRVLVLERARETLEALREGSPPPQGAIVEKTFVQSEPGDIDELVAELEALRPARPVPDRGREGFEFDVRAAETIHRTFDRRHPAIADQGFWRYLAVVKLHKIIDWRHGGRDGRAQNLENFGIRGGLVECYPYRCWLQADIGFDGSRADPYAWSRLGDADLWRSHLFRQNWARNRQAARAFLRVVCGEPQGGAPVVPGCDPRKLAKEVRRVSATLTLEALDEESLTQLMEELAIRCK